jgi:Methyltransferase domain
MIDLVMHTTRAIVNAHAEQSWLPEDVLKLEGFSSSSVRRLLNNMCSFDNCHFLEVGTYHGATAISASYGNNGRFVTIDNFSEYGGREECVENLMKYQGIAPVELITSDVWDVPLDCLSPVDVLFYDGAHDAGSTKRAIEHFAACMADTCVVIIDDWNWSKVRTGARCAKPARSWYPLAHWELFTNGNRDSQSWWNGLMVGVYSLRVN